MLKFRLMTQLRWENVKKLKVKPVQLFLPARQQLTYNYTEPPELPSPANIQKEVSISYLLKK